MYKRTAKKDLNFEGQKLTVGRHKLHPYPAMLHPLLVNFLLDKYAKKENIIFDPFCGSGVTLSQSVIKGYKASGFDINPLALLIAKTKTNKYKKKLLIEDLEKIKKKLKNVKKIDVPEINNINYWYTEDVITDLGKIRYILKNTELNYKNFFIISFAFICRNQSLTRNGEFKRYRIKKEKIEKTENQVLYKFIEHSNKMIEIFVTKDIPKKSVKPMLTNSEEPINPNIKYDLVITSPPYGDSRTTVAYGEYSSFGSEWIDDINEYGNINYKVDRECLGKNGPLNEELKEHPVLIKILKKIEKEDVKRANDVLQFFNGYYNTIRNINNNLNKKGMVCFIVGNRTVKGCQIPMDQITASFLESVGLSFEGIYTRDILNKVMPSKNSPTNKKGVKAKTMSNEYIVVFNKNNNKVRI